jgi:hypothetical protein
VGFERGVSGFGLNELLIWIAGYAVFVGVIVVLYLVVTRGSRRLFGPRRRLEEEVGVTLLRLKLKRGEIGHDEFEMAVTALTDVADGTDVRNRGG